MSATLPGSSDIYLEADGKKVAVVQSYAATARKTERSIEAFGESEPVAAITGQPSYTLELTRLYATDSAISDGINFHELEDFSLVIVKPDRRIVYTGCNWSRIDENGAVGELVAEKISLIAAHRVEMDV
ncbi:MAG: hypothetical protein LUC21_01615 [Oscillospiraceae bacterium]|nr:hypothetical protein [Oscillospiraceae bacterium]MCD8008579.1 hypothetical protein [Clostridiales bacterium]MCC8091480.1 hypothetical protein [Oscillospiraceae bacterium]MCC8156636.1 hypothetical protein [Oscillospiraceae bacterium]MCD7853266.1 hypothetical protein [Oscillospiraceae bacterium]